MKIRYRWIADLFLVLTATAGSVSLLARTSPLVAFACAVAASVLWVRWVNR